MRARSTEWALIWAGSIHSYCIRALKFVRMIMGQEERDRLEEFTGKIYDPFTLKDSQYTIIYYETHMSQ